MTDTDNKKIDVLEMADILRALIKEAPAKDATIRSCYYRSEAVLSLLKSDQDHPSVRHLPVLAEELAASPAHCIAGQVIYTLGGESALNSLVECASILRDDTPDFATLGQNTNTEVALQFMTEGALRLLRAVQQYQDMGLAWGEAFRHAELERGIV